MWKIEGDKAWIESAHKRQPENSKNDRIYYCSKLYKILQK